MNGIALIYQWLEFDGLNSRTLAVSKSIRDEVFFFATAKEMLFRNDSSLTYSGGLGVQIKSSDSSFVYGMVGYKSIDRDEGVQFKLGNNHKAFNTVEFTNEVVASIVNIDTYLDSYHEVRFHISDFSSAGFGVELNHSSDEPENTFILSVRASF